MSFPASVVTASPFFEKPVLVLDFLSQFHIEWMEVGRDNYRGLHRRIWTKAGQHFANLQLQVADFVICANERQRDAYIGTMASLGLLAPETYDQDSTLRRLIDVAPHGLRPEPFVSGFGRVKGRFPGIEERDKLLLWLGGIPHWYDTSTLLRALARVRMDHPEVKLLFLGTNYPGADVGRGLRLSQTIEEAQRLGLWNRGVYMHSEWLPQEQVAPFLQEADAAVTTYFTSAETRFAHRTRFQDYIWARLPIICTEGDVLSDEVCRRGWGVAIAEKDEDALVAAICRLTEDRRFAARCRMNLALAASEMSWESAFEPLARFFQCGLDSIARPRGQRRAEILRSALAYGAVRMLERGVLQASKRFESMADGYIARDARPGYPEIVDAPELVERELELPAGARPLPGDEAPWQTGREDGQTYSIRQLIASRRRSGRVA
jgi:glycosyltransferase involved in cell wall biosynthesis